MNDRPVTQVQPGLHQHDKSYIELHLLAAMTMRNCRHAPWYDARFLSCYETAKAYLAEARPAALAGFEAGFEALRTPPDFAVRKVADLLEPATLARVRETAAGIAEERLERHELRDFGRLVVHDHPFFSALQQDLLPQVSQLAGRPLTASYNFLSLYGDAGKCDLHMDEPLAMFTLDFCIDQEGDWPLMVSKPIDWPGLETLRRFEPAEIMADPALDFRSHVIRANEAILFAGSGQWHYRAPMSTKGFSTLLFLHYLPAGTESLAFPPNWSTHFDLPELQPLCDLFSELLYENCLPPGTRA